MFDNTRAFSSFAVDNLSRAKQFYGQILQLQVAEDTRMGLLTLHVAGGAKILIYPKPDHTPAGFTVLNFPVPDIAKTVADLKALGVNFESYQEESYQTDADHIARGDGPSIAWFKDPAGNILSVLQVEE